MNNSLFEDHYLDVPGDKDNLSRGSLLQGEHRVSCHRCGNMRKNVIKCIECPHVFCRKCGDKLIAMDGLNAFVDGCPFCKDLCCCGTHRSAECTRQFHCYKKCLKSRMSPSSRNTSPRSTSSAKNRTAQAKHQQQAPIEEEFMQDFSDSEDEVMMNQAGLHDGEIIPAQFESSEKQSLACVTTDSYDGQQGLSHRGFPLSAQLAPIDTSLGYLPDSPAAAPSRPRSKSSRSGTQVETPQKKVRINAAKQQQMSHTRSSNEELSQLDHFNQMPFRQACGVAQPPFNTGVPSIFAPHSLTPETNPFFLQSSLPCTNSLPPLRSLLQSGRANPFLHALPPYLQNEVRNVQGFDQPPREPYVHYPFALGQRTTHWMPPDPAVGYGFTFGGNLGLTAPPWIQAPSTGGRGFHGINADAGTSFLLQPREAPPVISTPNIDRACLFLQNQARISKTDRRTTAPALLATSSSSSFSVSNGSPEHNNSSSNLPQDSQSSSSQMSELFATPQVSLPAPAPLTQPSSQQQAMFAQFTQDQEYQWTGSSINSLHNLGVAVLTPAGLPQCTPITAAPAGPGPGPGIGVGLGHGQSFRVESNAQQQQADEHENMLFLHSMLNDTFADLAQDDLFALHRDSNEFNTRDLNVAGGGTSTSVGADAGRSSNGVDSSGVQPVMDPDSVIERWLQSARSPVPATAPPQHAFCTPQQQLRVGDK